MKFYVNVWVKDPEKKHYNAFKQEGEFINPAYFQISVNNEEVDQYLFEEEETDFSMEYDNEMKALHLSSRHKDAYCMDWDWNRLPFEKALSVLQEDSFVNHLWVNIESTDECAYVDLFEETNVEFKFEIELFDNINFKWDFNNSTPRVWKTDAWCKGICSSNYLLPDYEKKVG